LSRTLPSLLLASLALAACSSPPPEPYAVSALEPAREALKQGDPDEAWDLLDSLERDWFDRSAQGEYSRLAGDIAWARGDIREAIRNYQDYLRFQGPTADSRVVEDRLFQAGLEFLDGQHRVFGIFTERSRGAATLTNLATLAPMGEHAAEALARVGEYHYAAGDFESAEDSFRLLLRQHSSSAWADLATFRLGMSLYRRIEGPWVDGNLIERARNQLREYLRRYPSGLHREEAGAVVAELEEMLAAHELLIGDYYATIGNTRGARLHYQRAIGHASTQAASEAQARLEALPPKDPPLPPAPGENEG